MWYSETTRQPHERLTLGDALVAAGDWASVPARTVAVIVTAEPGRPSSRRAPRFPGLPRPPARTLAVMHSWQPPSYALEPPGTFTPDPDGCWHCRNNPGYAHRHWRERKAGTEAPARQDGRVWRFLFWVFSDWGMGRRAGQAPASRPADGGRQD